MQKITLGLLGLGTVGAGVADLLLKNKTYYEKKFGFSLNLKVAIDRNISAPTGIRLPSSLLSENIGDILNDPHIQIFVELIGGVNPAGTYIREALKKRKHIVTANKSLLAEQGPELFQLAQANQCDIYFEGSVGGTIPVIKVLSESLSANRIFAIYGIMNGTSNFILSKMSEEKLSFKAALKLAQTLGLAEANPAFDVQGTDAQQKLSILASIAFNSFLSPSDIFTKGITKITEEDIRYAGELNYRIKPIAMAKRIQKTIACHVLPMLIPQTHPLASVNGSFNAFYITGHASGPLFLYGQGAGRFPTASAVVADIIDLAKNIVNHAPRRSVPFHYFQKKTLQPPRLSHSRYYFRFSTADRPGVLAQITSILGKNQISIRACIQPESLTKKIVSVIMETHPALEAHVQRAVQQIDRLKIIRNRTNILRIEDF